MDNISQAYSVKDEISSAINNGFNERLGRYAIDFDGVRRNAEQSQNIDTLRLLSLIQSLKSWICDG
jgi:hypothetical protein